VHILVQAFARLAARFPEARLLIIGQGEYRAEIVRLIEASGVAEKIHLIPFVSQRDLKRHIDASAMVVLPSFSEGLGRIVLEAMSCGRPVIVSDIAAVQDLITTTWNGLLVTPGDVHALAAAIETLLHTPELAMKLGVNGRQLVQDRYCEAAFVKGYNVLIETAMQQFPSPPSHSLRHEAGRQC
jgi:glycosyltransferase involved in cell wall biosynthesis